MVAKKNGDLPAHPLLLDTKSNYSGGQVADDYFEGMTKREEMAMHIMAGLCANPELVNWSSKNYAEHARARADTLLAELEKTK